MFHYHKKKMYHRNKGFGMTRHDKGNCTPNERMILTKVCDDDCYFHLLPTCCGLGWAEDPLEEMRRDGVVDPELSAESLLNLSKKLGVSVLTDPVGVGPRDLKYYLISTKRLCWLDMYLSPSWRFNSFTSLFKSAKQSLRPFSLGRLGINWRRSFKAASSISDWIEQELDCCISSWVKRDLVQVLFNDRDHLEPPDVTQAGLESNLELLQLLPVQDLLLSQSVQQPVPEKFLNQLNQC